MSPRSNRIQPESWVESHSGLITDPRPDYPSQYRSFVWAPWSPHVSSKTRGQPRLLLGCTVAFHNIWWTHVSRHVGSKHLEVVDALARIDGLVLSPFLELKDRICNNSSLERLKTTRTKRYVSLTFVIKLSKVFPSYIQPREIHNSIQGNRTFQFCHLTITSYPLYLSFFTSGTNNIWQRTHTLRASFFLYNVKEHFWLFTSSIKMKLPWCHSAIKLNILIGFDWETPSGQG